jgi:hypothetical protein
VAEKDLVILVADKNIEETIKELLQRPESFGIRSVHYAIYRHPHRDPGCLRESHDFLKIFIGQFSHALVIFDREGCGKEDLSRIELEHEVGQRLSESGWDEQAAAVILDPELESWVWARSPHVVTALGWSGDSSDLRSWLSDHGFSGSPKPQRPKEAMEAVLRYAKKPRSSAIYAELARKVGLRHCVDPVFIRFRELLTAWFSSE